MGKLTPRYLRQNVNLCIGVDLLEQSVLVDLAVDRDCEALLEMGREIREALGEEVEELVHAGGLDLELGYAAGELAQCSDQRHVGHGRDLAYSGPELSDARKNDTPSKRINAEPAMPAAA